MKITLNNKEIGVEIMDTPNSISTGMMGREHLDGGMLFVFDKVGERSFWMKNCLIPLDIITNFLGSKVTILENSPDITKYFIANIASTVSFSLAIISDEIHPGIK